MLQEEGKHHMTEEHMGEIYFSCWWKWEALPTWHLLFPSSGGFEIICGDLQEVNGTEVFPPQPWQGERYISRKTPKMAESPSTLQHGEILSVFILFKTFQEHYVHTGTNGSFFFLNLFLEMFIIKHPVLELLKTVLSKESPNLVNNFKASRYFFQTWVGWKHSKNFITSVAPWCNCVISNPSDTVGEI